MKDLVHGSRLVAVLTIVLATLVAPAASAEEDIIPPTTEASVSPAPNALGWINMDATVTLTAVDNAGGSGVATTEYSYDGVTWNTYGGPIVIAAEGATTLYYRSIDNAGNIEVTAKSLAETQQLDLTASFNSDAYGTIGVYDGVPAGPVYPVNPGTSYPDPDYGAIPMDMKPAGAPNVWVSQGSLRTSGFPTTLSLNASFFGGGIWIAGFDAGWGYLGSVVRVDYVVDGVAHSTTYTPTGMEADWCVPTQSAGLVAWAPRPPSGFWCGDISVGRIEFPQGVISQVSITDVSAGPGGDPDSVPVFAVTLGRFTGGVKSITVNIDKTAPNVGIQSPEARTYLSSQSVTLDFDASDAHLDTVSATLDGDPVTDGQTISLADLGAGQYSLTVTASDTAGNVTTSSVTFNVINQIPSTVDVDPNALNLKSRSDKNAVTVYVELPVPYQPADLLASSARLKVHGQADQSVSALLAPSAVGDHDSDGIPDRMLKFDRAAVIALLNALGVTSGDVTLEVTVTSTTGLEFGGTDTIKVLAK